MWFSYEQTKKIFWEEKATELFKQAWLTIRKKSDPKDREYIKLSEWAHWKLLHNYLKNIWIKHTHIWNESWQWWTKNIIIMMAKKKASWVSKWFPDYLIYIPTLESHIQLCIELKKTRWVNGGLNGSEISDEQIWWQNLHNDTICSYSHFSHGSNEAIELVEEYISKFKNKTIMACVEDWILFNNKYKNGKEKDHT